MMRRPIPAPPGQPGQTPEERAAAQQRQQAYHARSRMQPQAQLHAQPQAQVQVQPLAQPLPWPPQAYPGAQPQAYPVMHQQPQPHPATHQVHMTTHQEFPSGPMAQYQPQAPQQMQYQQWNPQQAQTATWPNTLAPTQVTAQQQQGPQAQQPSGLLTGTDLIAGATPPSTTGSSDRTEIRFMDSTSVLEKMCQEHLTKVCGTKSCPSPTGLTWRTIEEERLHHPSQDIREEYTRMRERLICSPEHSKTFQLVKANGQGFKYEENKVGPVICSSVWRFLSELTAARMDLQLHMARTAAAPSVPTGSSLLRAAMEEDEDEQWAAKFRAKSSKQKLPPPQEEAAHQASSHSSSSHKRGGGARPSHAKPQPRGRSGAANRVTNAGKHTWNRYTYHKPFVHEEIPGRFKGTTLKLESVVCSKCLKCGHKAVHCPK